MTNTSIAQDNEELCYDMIRYDLCGSRIFMDKLLTEFQMITNFSSIDEKEIIYNVHKLRGSDASKSLSAKNYYRNKKLEKVWNHQILSELKDTVTIGPFPFLNEVNGMTYAIWGPSMAVKNNNDLSLFRAMIKNIIFYMRLGDQILINDKPLYRVNLKPSNHAIHTYNRQITRLCEAILDESNAINSSDCNKLFNLELMAQSIPSSVQLFRDQTNDNPNVIHSIYKITWMMTHYYKLQREYMLTVPRRVIIVDTGGKNSPRVDLLGNLYIPKYFLSEENWSFAGKGIKQSCRSNAGLLNIIMRHEKQHVSLQLRVFNGSLFALITDDLFDKEGLKKAMPGNFRNYMNLLISTFRSHDETLIDLLALEELKGNICARREYAEYVAKYDQNIYRRKQLELSTTLLNLMDAQPNKLSLISYIVSTDIQKKLNIKKAFNLSDKMVRLIEDSSERATKNYYANMSKMAAQYSSNKNPWVIESKIKDLGDKLINEGEDGDEYELRIPFDKLDPE